MDMDVLALEDRRLDAVGRRARLDEAERRRDAFGHHVAELAGGLDLALAGGRDALDRQQFTADFGPRKASDRTDLRFFFRHAVLVFAHTGELAEVLGRDDDALGLLLEDL